MSRHPRYFLLYSLVVYNVISQSVIDLVYLKLIRLCILVQSHRLLRNVCKFSTCVLFGVHICVRLKDFRVNISELI